MAPPTTNALQDNQEQKGDLSYHYWATKTDEPPLPKPEPKKLTDADVQALERTASSSKPVGASAWNAAGTWEEKSHMEWAKGEMERRLVGLSATTMELKVVSIKGCTGDANVVITRGRPRHGFDLELKLGWTAVSGDTTIEGSLEFAEVSRDTVVDDELEAEVKVDTKKVKAEHQKAVSAAAKSLVPAIRQQLVSFDTEFKARAEGGA